MAATCTRDTLISGAACLNGSVLNSHEMRVRKVWFMAKQLAALGGTDYTSDPATLAGDANTLTCGMQPKDIDAAKLVIERNNATNAGAALNSDPSKLAADVKCLNNQPDNMLDRMELLLRCKLGYGTKN